MIQNSKLIILVDIDDTINNLYYHWIDWLNSEYGTSVGYDDIHDWDLRKAFPELTEEEICRPVTEEQFWITVEPREDAMKFLRRLYEEGYEIYLCTATDYRNIKIKFEAIIQPYFPYIKWDHIIVAYNKSMIKGDIMVDDGIHNLEGGDYFKILMDAPHNRRYDAEANGMVRALDWEEAYHIIWSNYMDKIIEFLTD